MSLTLLACLFLGAFVAYWMGFARSLSVAKNAGGRKNLHSLPGYHGAYTAMWWTIPAVLVLFLWAGLEGSVVRNLVWSALPDSYQSMTTEERSLVFNQINMIDGTADVADVRPELVEAAANNLQLKQLSQQILAAVFFLLGSLGLLVSWLKIRHQFRARNRVEGLIRVFLILSSMVAILTTVGILFSVLFESIRFFKAISPAEFLFGLHWSPQMAIRADQVGSAGGFGSIPLFTGTLLISAIAMVVAVPTGLMSAIYLSEYASTRLRNIVKPLLEMLAGIPTVVYGFFAALTVAPAIRDIGSGMGLDVSSESALAAGLVMGVMIIPFVSSLSDDVIHAVPQSMRDGSYGLGATRSETIRKVVIPAALPGIVGGILLAVSRAIGETMIVVMAAGLAANLTANPLESVTTVTVQIVTLLTGDQEFDSPKTLAAFALGMVLFLVTLVLNIIALHVVNKYREQYE